MTIYLLLAVLVGLGGSALARAGLGRVLAIAAARNVAGSRVRLRLGVAPTTVITAFSRTIGRAASAMLGHMREHAIAGPLIAGAINGVMPCGLVQAALTAAAATGTMAGAMALWRDSDSARRPC